MLIWPLLAPDALWKGRFRAPVVAASQIAALAPTRGRICSNRSETYQQYAWDVPTGALRSLTERPDGVLAAFLSADGRWLYYLDDACGNEIGHYVRRPFDGGPAEDLTPDLPPYSSLELAISRSGNLLAFRMGDDGGQHLVCVALGAHGSVGRPRVVYSMAGIAHEPIVSADGATAVVASNERGGAQRFALIAVDTRSGARIGELSDGPESSMRPVGFAPIPGDARLLATSNASGVERPLIWNPRTGERVDLALAGPAGELAPIGWDQRGQEVLLRQVRRAVQRLYRLDLAIGARPTRLAHPRGALGHAYFGPSGEVFLEWSDPAHPWRLIALDRRTGQQARTVLAEGEVVPGRPFRSVTVRSSDGVDVQAWLGVPDGAGPFPAVLHMHGGPRRVQTAGFSPEGQAWLDHGFAHMSVNYRGSITFGRAFAERIWGNLGHWEVEDLVAARAWLVRSGVARSDQVLLTGWSYGGYLTLMALGKRPELWAGGMAGIAPADLTAMYEDAAVPLKKFLVSALGGTPQERPERYAASSPITYAERVSAPVLIIQGRNDTRCPPRPVELYEATLRALGRPIEVHWFDTGHLGPWATTELTIRHQELMLGFADRVLRGR